MPLPGASCSRRKSARRAGRRGLRRPHKRRLAPRHVGLGESVHFAAHYLGMSIGKWDETIEPVRAERDMAAAIGPIRKGMAAGVRQVAKAWAAGMRGTADKPIIEMEFQAAIGQHAPARPCADRRRAADRPSFFAAACMGTSPPAAISIQRHSSLMAKLGQAGAAHHARPFRSLCISSAKRPLGSRPTPNVHAASRSLAPAHRAAQPALDESARALRRGVRRSVQCREPLRERGDGQGRAGADGVHRGS